MNSFRIAVFISLLLGFQSVDASELLKNIEGPYSIVIRTPSSTIGIDQIRPLKGTIDCTEQRQLDRRANQQLDTLRNLFSSGLHTQNIYSSRYCRSQQTALSLFGESKITIEPFLDDACFNSAVNNVNNNEMFKELMLNTTVPQVIIAHNCNIRMLFSEQLKRQCQRTGRLEAGQWMVVQLVNEELRIVECANDPEK